METLHHSGRILTMVDQVDAPEAVLARDSRIVAVGSPDQVRAAGAPGAEPVHLTSRTPSFIDSHGHLLQHGVFASPVDLEHAHSIAEIVSAFGDRLALRDREDRTPLIGARYTPQLPSEGCHPTREDLDAMATQLPVLALHRSIHVAVGNSCLIDGAGVAATTPGPRPAGSVASREEHPAMAAFMPIPSPGGGGGLLPTGLTDPVRAAELAAVDNLRHGNTTAQEGAGALNLDLVVTPWSGGAPRP